MISCMLGMLRAQCLPGEYMYADMIYADVMC